MMRKMIIFLFLLVGFQQMSIAAGPDDWQAVSDKQAVDFVAEFFSHMSMDNGQWEDAVLEQYLAPEVLEVLADSAATSEQKYASWLLSATDNSEMLMPSSHSGAPYMTDDGRVAKEQSVYYWGDTWLRDSQMLYFTVKSKAGRMLITQVDGMDGSAAASIWLQFDQREEGREMMEEDF